MNTLIILCAKYLIVVPVLVLGLYWLKAETPLKKKIFFLSLIVLPVSYLLAKIGGHFYMDPRPFVEGNFVPLISHAADNGFPSDHTLLSTALAGIMYVFNKRLGIVLLVVTLIIGFARVLVGVHHTIDILGSIVIAVVVTYLTNKVLQS